MTKKPKSETTQTKADKAEARAAAKRAQTEQKAEAAKAAAGSNSVDPKVRALFEHHLKKVRPLADRVASLIGDLRALYKVAKADGFTSEQFKLAMDVSNADGTENIEGVEKLKDKLRRQAATLLYIGSSLGTQFDMFAQPEAPSEEESLRVAYDTGKRCSQQDNKADPRDYAPGSPQYNRYMEGFHDHEAKKLAGMKPTAVNGAEPEVPTSGRPMTRAEYRAQQEAAQREDGDTTH